MWHWAMIGMTGSGKTYLAQQSARVFRRRGVGTLILHKHREPWPADCASWQTDDPEEFLRMFWASRSCACFIEIADAAVDKSDDRFWKCFQQGRHDGHRCYYLAQRGQRAHPEIRDNCGTLCLFSCTMNAAKFWAEEFNDPELLKAASLPPHQYFFKPSRHDPARLVKLAS